MMKDGGLSFETPLTALKIEFLPPNNGSKKCLGIAYVNFATFTEKHQCKNYFLIKS